MKKTTLNISNVKFIDDISQSLQMTNIFLTSTCLDSVTLEEQFVLSKDLTLNVVKSSTNKYFYDKKQF